MRRAAASIGSAVVFAGLLCGCPPSAPATAAPSPERPHTAVEFLKASLRHWPRDDSPGELAVTDPDSGRVACYDSALVALVLMRAGDRERAARVLLGLAALQDPGGGLPFSFTLPAPDAGARYERAGAIAWVGYAAAEYLDADPGGPAREEALTLAHHAATYLLRHQVTAPGDPREGLILGGAGDIRYDVVGDEVREVLEPGEVDWASVEHNVDSYFFLRALARVSGVRAYAEVAAKVAQGLLAHAWSEPRGQFVEGVAPDGPGGPDEPPALDCASWGSVFLSAAAERDRAEIAFRTADARYAARDPKSGARGHRPYAWGPLFSSAQLARHFARSLRATSWEKTDLVWPEGSAGVALAAWRSGHTDRARAIVDALEALRSADGSLPTATLAVPFLFDREPSLAGTAWVELVRFELERPPGQPTLWAP
jgi:hypothetical protein